ncbi:MAG: phosphotransferase [Microbacterium sp.]|nr:phosphotransferase [Microbacterium sp.]
MDSTLACLAAWMPRQRWYASKGRTPALRLAATWDMPTADADADADADARARTLLVWDESSLPPVLYQIPVVARSTETVDAPIDHIIGSPEPGTTLIDGPFDRSYTAALLRLVTEGGRGVGAHARATGRPAASAPAVGDDLPANVLVGEQSNTSMIYRAPNGGSPVICKIYRQLHAGSNPDIELQTALAEAGSPYVPRAVGHVDGEWPDASAHATASGSLAFAQEFLDGVDDAWRVALRAAAAGEDFTERAWALGVATADVHASLATLFPVAPTTSADRAAIAAGWRGRLSTAIAEIPGLGDRRSAIEAVYDRALTHDWPDQQRIHGDFHLGQVILAPDRGWVLLDFEGEPMRPIAERVRPDLALRDVAGMLRSFDYVAGSIRLDQPDRSRESVRLWARSARVAFLGGFAEASGTDLATVGPLLDALELDKAVYEAIYEARNRPTWITIPLRAIARLSDPTR